MTLALVLGCAVTEGAASPALARRVDLALRLWREGRVEAIVVSGGPAPGGVTEAGVMAAWLEDQGVPEAAIRMEPRATTTRDNMRLSAPLIGAAPVLIVTDWYHAPRASLAARAYGLDARLVTVPPRLSVAQVRSALREIPACLIYWWKLRSLAASARAER